MKRLAVYVLLLAIGQAVAGGASAGSVLVMTSTDPNLAPGAMIDDTAPLSLAAGTEVTLLGRDGTMVTLTGPFQGVPPAATGAGEPDLVAAIAGLIGEGGQDTSEFGSVRGAEATTADPWLVDVSVPGTKCVDPAGPLGLWRAEPGVGSFGRMGGAAIDVSWPDGGGSAPWPAEVPREDGGAYALVPVGGSAVTMTLRVAPSGLPSAAHMARWLAEAGCPAQARRLLAAAIVDKSELAMTLGTTASRHGVGDALTLTLALSADAHVECLYEATDGSAVRLFPNSFNGGPRLAGPFVHLLPRPGDGLVLTFSGPAGTENVHCFGWRGDPGDALPDDLAAADITQSLARDVEALHDALFSSETPPEAHAELSITVEP